MADVVQSFVDEPTQEGFNNLRKAELVEVARILEIPIKTSDRKADIKGTISEFFLPIPVFGLPLCQRMKQGQMMVKLSHLW